MPAALIRFSRSLTCACRSRRQTADAALREVLAAVQARGGVRISAGTVPINALVHSSGIFGGQDVPARTLLAQIVGATGALLRWELLYDPDGKAYFFNLLR